MPHSRALQRLDPRVLGLLALAVLINMMDRGNLSTVAPVLGQELHLSHQQLGWMMSAFFWVYAPGQLLAGSLTDRFSVKYVLAAGFFLWAAATFGTGFARGFTAILVLRLVLGLGESALFPAASKMLAAGTQETQRGRANAILLVGLSAGPAIGTLAGSEILAASGWRMVFWVFGAGSLLWLVPWLRTPAVAATVQAGPPPPPYRQMLRCRPLLAMAVGHFCVNYMGYFLLSWLPSYLVNDRHLTLQGMGWAGGAVYATEAISLLGFATIADLWIARGGGVSRVRRTFLVVGTAAIAVFMLAAAWLPTAAAFASLILATVGRGMQLGSMYPAAQSFAGPRAAGRWMGIENGLANTAGIIGPVLTGWTIDVTGNYVAGFALVAAVSVVGVGCWAWGIGRLTPVDWDAPALSSPA
jgi:MFS family permease